MLIDVALEIKEENPDDESDREYFEFVDHKNTTDPNQLMVTFNRTLVKVPLLAQEHLGDLVCFQKSCTYRFNVTVTNGVGLMTSQASSAFLVQEKSNW